MTEPAVEPSQTAPAPEDRYRVQSVERAFQRVGIGEVGIDEPISGQAGEPLLALDRELDAGPERRLEHVAVERHQVIETAELDAENS